MKNKRLIWIVLDGVGIGELPDALQYGDAGSHTLGNIHRVVNGLKIPNMLTLGLGNIQSSMLPEASVPKGAYGRCMEASPGKDTTTGHWELAGIVLNQPFPLFPNGFPEAFIEALCQKTGRNYLGNIAASGTEIIERLGQAHLANGSPILYTSADSVCQIAAHEAVIPIEELYAICRQARTLLDGPWRVGRVIARPFTGNIGHFVRLPARKDFAFPPPDQTVLDRLTAHGIVVTGIGKIKDIFADRGVTISRPTHGNADGLQKIEAWIRGGQTGLLFANLIDFDMLYGHRNDVKGFADALQHFDRALGNIMAAMHQDDLLLITADHGCDPTIPGTDHTREYIPMLWWGKGIIPTSLSTKTSFADIGATIAEYYAIKPTLWGQSFLEQLQFKG